MLRSFSSVLFRTSRENVVTFLEVFLLDSSQTLKHRNIKHKSHNQFFLFTSGKIVVCHCILIIVIYHCILIIVIYHCILIIVIYHCILIIVIYHCILIIVIYHCIFIISDTSFLLIQIFGFAGICSNLAATGNCLEN